jgi:hypothetical protein
VPWIAIMLLSGPIIFEAATLVMSHLNYRCKKCVYFFDRIIRWLCWSASCVFDPMYWWK